MEHTWNDDILPVMFQAKMKEEAYGVFSKEVRKNIINLFKTYNEAYDDVLLKYISTYYGFTSEEDYMKLQLTGIYFEEIEVTKKKPNLKLVG